MKRLLRTTLLVAVFIMAVSGSRCDALDPDLDTLHGHPGIQTVHLGLTHI